MNELNEKTTKTTIITAPEIVCGSCVNSIKRVLENMAGVTEVDVDIESKEVTVNHDEKVSRESIVYALDRAGYTAS